MALSHFEVGMLSVGLLVLGAGTTVGQEYPNKPIRLVTSTPGGGADFVARFLSSGLSSQFGQQVIVDNRGSMVNGEIVSKAPPDGYTVLVAGSTFWLAPFLYEHLPWDPIRDFSPVTIGASSPNILVVHPSVAANSTKDLIDLAKQRPGELNYASGGSGSAPHLAAELFNQMAGVSLKRINYKGSGAAFNDLIGGHVQAMFPVGSAGTPHVKSGKLRALAVTSPKPTALFPGLPTIAATLPGYEAMTIIAVFVPAKTPAAIIKRLNQESVRAFNKPDVKERIFNSGAEVVANSPDEMAVMIKSEMTRMGKLIKDANIQIK